MKTILLLIITSICVPIAQAQDINRKWYGTLNAAGQQIPLIFHIEYKDGGYVSTMDSPSQGAMGIPIKSTEFNNSILTLKIDNINAQYESKWNGKYFEGTFKQNGMSFPFNLTTKANEISQKAKPQDPIKPYPYYTEDVNFANESAQITLAGTISLPQKNGVFPAVVLISGSGAQNRDEELLGHKPFLVLADHLTKKGIAVLRFDDRGFGKSTGNFKDATTADFKTDVEAAIKYLQTRKDIVQNKIGLIGHSEGGVIAPMIAAINNQVSFIVMLAGPGIKGKDITLLQSATMSKASGLNEEQVAKSNDLLQKIIETVVEEKDSQVAKTKIAPLVEEGVKLYPNYSELSQEQTQKSIQQLVEVQTSPWRKFFYSYDPAPTLAKVKCPVLALWGSKDIQVPPLENSQAVRKALAKGGNKHFEIKELNDLNHLFQEAKTGLPAEYPTIEQTFSPMALNEISNWILKINK